MKLYRSRTDSKIFGLCGGLAEMMSVDSTIVRVVTVVTTFFSAGTVIPLYILASLVIPKEPVTHQTMHTNGYFHQNQGPYGSPGPHHSHGPHGPQHSPGYTNPNGQFDSQSNLDDMMKDIEQKAMRKEIEELRAKLAKIENNMKGEQ